MKKTITQLSVLGLAFFPMLASAQTGFATVKDLIEAVGKFINTSLMPVFVFAAILYFLWNIAEYITRLDNEKEREAFKKYSVNAILALFIMLSVWGIIAIATNALFGTQPVVPQFRTNDQGNGGPPQ